MNKSKILLMLLESEEKLPNYYLKKLEVYDGEDILGIDFEIEKNVWKHKLVNTDKNYSGFYSEKIYDGRIKSDKKLTYEYCNRRYYVYDKNNNLIGKCVEIRQGRWRHSWVINGSFESGSSNGLISSETYKYTYVEKDL